MQNADSPCFVFPGVCRAPYFILLLYSQWKHPWNFRRRASRAESDCIHTGNTHKTFTQMKPSPGKRLRYSDAQFWHHRGQPEESNNNKTEGFQRERGVWAHPKTIHFPQGKHFLRFFFFVFELLFGQIGTFFNFRQLCVLVEFLP